MLSCQEHPWLIVISGSCTYRQVHTVTSVWQGSRSCVILHCNCARWLHLHEIFMLWCRPNCALCQDSYPEQYLSKLMCEFYGRAQEKSIVHYLVAEPFNSTASSGLTTLALISSGMKINRGPGSSVGIAIDCGQDGPGSNSGGGEIFRTCPHRPWGPRSLLYNRYRVFPGDRKRPGCDAEPSPPSSAEVYKQSRAIPLLSPRAFVACKKGETYLWKLTT
jgi:hypothetical protein